MSKIIVAWAVSYDNIISYKDNLKNVLNDDIWKKDISYFVNNLSIQNWWNAHNIVYNLSILWEESSLVSSVWKDFNFNQKLKENSILENVFISEENITSRNFITTDISKKNINSTYLWALNEMDKLDLNIYLEAKYGVVSSLPVLIMQNLLKKFKEAWLAVFFSPWNMVSKMTKYEIEKCFSFSDYLIVNLEEYEKLKELWEKTDEDMITTFEKMIITYGIEGSKVFYSSYNMIEVPWVNNPDFKDSIWAWDAYIAWLIKWISDGFSWEQAAKMWSVLASISTWYTWWSSHDMDFGHFQSLYLDTFWESLV